MNIQSVKSAAVKALAASAMLAACAAFGETLDPTLFRRSAEVSTSYTQSSTLTNFPLLVRISTDRLPGFNAATAGANGMGVRFADAEGTLLNHEIDEFHADGDSLYWVSVPRLRSGAKLTVYWDPLPGAELPAVSASTVWDCADYVAVWHFNDTNLTNSASTEMPIVYGANYVASNVAGQAGLCLWRDKGLTVDDYLNHGVNHAHWTWSTWIRWANHPSNVQMNYITKGTYVASNGGWFTEYKKTDRNMGLFSGTTSIGFGTVIAVNWNHIAMSYDGANVCTYVNGTRIKNLARTIQDGSYNFYMGSCGNTFQDELRIRNAVSTPDWMNAEKAQQSNLQYVTFSVNPPRRERVQLDTTQFLRSAGIRASGYTGMATLTNFPFLVRLSSARLPGFDPADAGEGGANLRFADLDGTLLAHDVDEWNPEGESIIWVSVPEFKPGTAIALYWDPKPGAELPAVTPSDVWDAAGYCGVWHCGDTELVDASSAAIPASYATGEAISNDVAFAGRGIRRDGAVTIADYLYRGVGFTHWSVSGWFQWPSHTADAQYNYLNKGNYNNRQGWFTEYKQSLTAHTLAYGTGQQAGTMSFGTMTATDWNHIAVAYDGAAVACYVNGYQVSSKALTIGSGQYNLFLMASVNAGMDEVRVRNAASSAGWIIAEKEMMADPDFATFLAEVPGAPVESLGPQFAGRFNCKVRITMPGYVSEAAETNFPMLVRLSRGNPKSFGPAACGAGGGGLRFFDEEGNLLPHEVDEWNPAGESLVWVLVPELTTNAAVVMCWAPREGGAVPAPDPGLVWARSGYKAVWHFASAGASMPNSAFGSMPMTAANAAAVSNAAGKVGQALSKGTTVSSPDYYVHNVPGAGPYSVSFWMKIPNLTASDFYVPIQKGEWMNGWMLQARNNIYKPRACYNSNWTDTSGSVDMREWHYFAFSYLNNQASFYYDGTYQELKWGGVSANPAAFLLCNNVGRTEQFDEVRVRAEKTSSARQRVEIANMTDPAFLAFEIMRDAGTVIYLK